MTYISKGGVTQINHGMKGFAIGDLYASDKLITTLNNIPVIYTDTSTHIPLIVNNDSLRQN